MLLIIGTSDRAPIECNGAELRITYRGSAGDRVIKIDEAMINKIEGYEV
jgi:hypothetical protein